MDDVQLIDNSVMEAQVRAEIDTQIATAKRYPRNLQKVHANALAMVESSKEIAMGCMYSVPKAGQRITGPSVRLAEIMASTWGNLRIKVDFLEEAHDYVLVQAVAIDLESNVAFSRPVRRRILDKDGKRYKTDVIETTVAAAQGIAKRNVIFDVIPAAFIKPIYDAARELAIGKETEFDAQRARCVKHFQALGIPAPTLLKHLGKLKVTDIKRDDVEYLIGIINAIKEGESVDDIFAVTRSGKPMDASAPSEPGKPTLDDVAAKAKAGRKQKAAAKAEPAPDENGEIPEDGEGATDYPEFGADDPETAP